MYTQYVITRNTSEILCFFKKLSRLFKKTISTSESFPNKKQWIFFLQKYTFFNFVCDFLFFIILFFTKDLQGAQIYLKVLGNIGPSNEEKKITI